MDWEQRKSHPKGRTYRCHLDPWRQSRNWEESPSTTCPKWHFDGRSLVQSMHSRVPPLPWQSSKKDSLSSWLVSGCCGEGWEEGIERKIIFATSELQGEDRMWEGREILIDARAIVDDDDLGDRSGSCCWVESVPHHTRDKTEDRNT